MLSTNIRYKSLKTKTADKRRFLFWFPLALENKSAGFGAEITEELRCLQQQGWTIRQRQSQRRHL